MPGEAQRLWGSQGIHSEGKYLHCMSVCADVWVCWGAMKSDKEVWSLRDPGPNGDDTEQGLECHRQRDWTERRLDHGSHMRTRYVSLLDPQTVWNPKGIRQMQRAGQPSLCTGHVMWSWVRPWQDLPWSQLSAEMLKWPQGKSTEIIFHNFYLTERLYFT